MGATRKYTALADQIAGASRPLAYVHTRPRSWIGVLPVAFGTGITAHLADDRVLF
jgi:hypothetical protein